MSSVVLRVKRKLISDEDDENGPDMLLYASYGAPSKLRRTEDLLEGLTLSSDTPRVESESEKKPLVFVRFARNIKDKVFRPTPAALLALPRVFFHRGKSVDPAVTDAQQKERLKKSNARIARQRAELIDAHRKSMGDDDCKTGPSAGDQAGGGGDGNENEKNEGGESGDQHSGTVNLQAQALRVRVFDLELGSSGVEDMTRRTTGAAVGENEVVLRRRWLGQRDAASALSRVTFKAALTANPRRVLVPLERVIDEAVWRAFKLGDLPAIESAILQGASVNYQRVSSDLTTSLMAAAHHGEAGAARWLVERGALVNLRDVNGRGAVDFARSAGHTELADLLKDVEDEELREKARWDAGAWKFDGDGENERAQEQTLEEEGEEQGGRQAAGGGVPEGGEGEGEDDVYDYYILNQNGEGGYEPPRGGTVKRLKAGLSQALALPGGLMVEEKNKEGGKEGGFGVEEWDWVREEESTCVNNLLDSEEEEDEEDEDAKEIDYPDDQDEEEDREEEEAWAKKPYRFHRSGEGGDGDYDDEDTFSGDQSGGSDDENDD